LDDTESPKHASLFCRRDNDDIVLYNNDRRPEFFNINLKYFDHSEREKKNLEIFFTEGIGGGRREGSRNLKVEKIVLLPPPIFVAV
jgi:hypothetical protein